MTLFGGCLLNILIKLLAHHGICTVINWLFAQGPNIWKNIPVLLGFITRLLCLYTTQSRICTISGEHSRHCTFSHQSHPETKVLTLLPAEGPCPLIKYILGVAGTSYFLLCAPSKRQNIFQISLNNSEKEKFISNPNACRKDA